MYAFIYTVSMYLSAHIEPAPNGSIKIGEAPRCPAVYQISTYVLYIWGPFFYKNTWGTISECHRTLQK